MFGNISQADIAKHEAEFGDLDQQAKDKDAQPSLAKEEDDHEEAMIDDEAPECGSSVT